MRVIGLMSGTSVDGVDAAFVETDGERIQATGPRATMAIPDALRADLLTLMRGANHGEAAGRDKLPGFAARVEAELTKLHAAAVRALDVPAELLGFHGQTILHAPERRHTWQIGDAALLARKIGVPVAGEFRLADVAAGGQGAPLVPVFHQALAAALDHPLLVVNIGGVANLTWIGADGGLLACDTGPGNALLDDFLHARTGVAMDRDGAAALAGVADETILRSLLADPYFARPAPKSLDRQHFAQALDAVSHLSTEDGAATLAAFTARAVVATKLPGVPVRVLVCGGGRHNPAIMRALSAAMKVPVEPVEAVGWDGDALEAQCFAFLAARVMRGLPLSFPGTTGVPYPMPGGRVFQP